MLPTEEEDESKQTPPQRRHTGGGGHYSNRYFMSDVEIAVVRETWTIIENDVTNCGVLLFLRIFELRPDAKEYFTFKNKCGEDLLADLHFQMHARRFMKAVGSMVDHADSPDLTLYPILLHLGEVHFGYTGKFFIVYMDTFLEAIWHLWTTQMGRSFSSDVQDAWRHLLQIMVTKLKEGHGIKTEHDHVI